MAAGMSSLLAEEQMVLDDIFRRTGLRFRYLGSINRNDRELMQRILPIAQEWVASWSEPMRRVLYMQFLTPYALPYIEDIIQWAPTATSKLDRELFTQILRALVTPKTAGRIWAVFQTLEPTELDFMLLARLARVASISEQVVEPILGFLRSAAERIERGELVRTFAMSDLQEYSRVRHPQVKGWFHQYLKSADPELRAMARRSSGIKPVLPEGCRVVRGSPEHSREVLSTEIDSDRLGDFLRNLERDMGAEFVPTLQPDQVVENLAEGRWLVYHVARSQRGPLELWLRLEDTCTIEVWVVMAQATRPN